MAETLMLADGIMEGIIMVVNDLFTIMMGVVRDESFDEIRFYSSMINFLISSQVLKVDDNDVGESEDGIEFGGDGVVK